MLHHALSNEKQATGRARVDEANSIYVNKSATVIICPNKIRLIKTMNLLQSGEIILFKTTNFLNIFCQLCGENLLGTKRWFDQEESIIERLARHFHIPDATHLLDMGQTTTQKLHKFCIFRQQPPNIGI